MPLPIEENEIYDTARLISLILLQFCGNKISDTNPCFHSESLFRVCVNILDIIKDTFFNLIYVYVVNILKFIIFAFSFIDHFEQCQAGCGNNESIRIVCIEYFIGFLKSRDA